MAVAASVVVVTDTCGLERSAGSTAFIAVTGADLVAFPVLVDRLLPDSVGFAGGDKRLHPLQIRSQEWQDQAGRDCSTTKSELLLPNLHSGHSKPSVERYLLVI